MSNFSSKAVSVVGKDFLKILRNPITDGALGIAAILALLADQFGNGYLFILLGVLSIIVLGFWRELNKYIIYQHEVIPLPVVINVANSADSHNALNALFQIIENTRDFSEHKKNLKNILNIEPEELIFNYSSDIYDKEMLQAFLQITRHNLEWLKSKTPKDTVIYLAYIGPISCAILVGTILARDGVNIFQYNKSSNSYYPVVEVKDRKLKEDIIEFEKFDIERQEKGCDQVAIAIDASSHKINLNDQSIRDYGDIIYLKSKSLGTIEYQEDWLQYCREIFKVLNFAQRNNYQEIKLIYSMPVSLGILLGMATQLYWPIILTQYEAQSQSYKDLMRLNEFKYYTGH
jgi:hypothetical protein